MGNTFLFLAQVAEGADVLASKGSNEYFGNLHNILIITISSLILGVILFFSVYLYRTRRNNRPRPHKHSAGRSEVVSMEPADESGERMRVRKKRRERIREHRPRNPTLQETGGLPPIRPDNELPKV